MAELWLFSHWEVAWFHWEPLGTKGDAWAFICTKNIQNRSRFDWVIVIFPWKVAWSYWKSHGTKVDHLGSFLPKISKIAQEMAYFGLLRIMMCDLWWWWLIQGFPLKDIKNKKGWSKGNAIDISGKSVASFTYQDK